ncbi:YeeE/YedE family protein [Acidimangrovimonas sediminis]|uniref:YeeE/YedE family protein n=1 Tax=Acidimangrovimonas sediminis TaxID=2056283 RepID=UPI001E410544|nr:YeeE/YedE thiosulfate transporter family protein [Acidimangrovimonas sediminis]
MLSAIPHAWIFGLAGGLMIGLAAAVLLLGNARIMGASGIVGGLVDGTGQDNLVERLIFVAALVGVPAIVVAVTGAPDAHVSGDLGLLVLAGLLVGFGTRMANGCTSGHGVCGMSRFSTRSIVATLAYLGAGFATMAVARHILGVI